MELRCSDRIPGHGSICKHHRVTADIHINQGVGGTIHPSLFQLTNQNLKDMACNQTLSGLVRDCSPSMGGIVEALIANKEDVTEISASSDMISSITMASSAKFKRYAFARNTGSLTSNYTIDQTTGVRYVASDLVLVFNRMETAKRVEISALAQNDLVIIVKDANGKYWLLGKDEPVNATAGDGLTGTARADRNGYSITLQDNSLEMPYEVDPSIIDALIG